ncbi:MAG: aminoglycoside phosphotransferase family protein [Clostridia bacterium]|nr:aminoglycoside phosphotransferase family protein [Clostridia bacterium]
MVYNQIKHVLRHFNFEGDFVSAEELHSGNINNTFRLRYRQRDGELRDYVLQQINTYVFKKPDEVMSNVQRVTDHQRAALEGHGLDTARRVLRLVECKKGGYMYRDDQGRCWRVYDFITGAVAYDRVENPEYFRQAGVAFGNFQKMLFDFPAEELHETIPDFHNTRKRFYAFVAAVAEDKAGRVKDVEKEIDFFFERRKMMSQIVDMIDRGEIPLRVTHNDTKVNNVMLDAETGEGLCVIDLDTVMPGSVLYDYGDAIRFGASTAAEDEPDTSKIALDLDLFRAFTEGFISQVRGALTETELKMLPLGIKVMTCELAMRFFTDYLDGDLYFKVKSPNHNLVRARAQMKLLEDIEQRYDQILDAIQEMLQK